MSIQYSGTLKIKDYMSKVDSNEIIFYGKEGENIYFYYKFKKKLYNVNFGEIDENISCKLLKEAIYVCAFSKLGQVKLKFLVLVYLENTNSENLALRDMETVDIDDLSNHDSAILYDTSDSNYKIICARDKHTNIIKCISIEFEVTYSNTIPSLTCNLNKYEINDYQATYLFNEDNCNFIEYNSEFLICCKKSDGIICDRRDKHFFLINRFNLELQGIITNLTLESDENTIKLTYSNEKSSEKGVYQYYIYPPQCNNVSVTLNAFQELEINLEELFQRKTNTKYYMMFQNVLYTNIFQHKINDEIKLKILDIKSY